MRLDIFIPIIFETGVSFSGDRATAIAAGLQTLVEVLERAGFSRTGKPADTDAGFCFHVPGQSPIADKTMAAQALRQSRDTTIRIYQAQSSHHGYTGADPYRCEECHLPWVHSLHTHIVQINGKLRSHCFEFEFSGSLGICRYCERNPDDPIHPFRIINTGTKLERRPTK